MNDVRRKTQKILDALLLPHGITSHHIRRGKVDSIAGGGLPSDDEYVVYRVISTTMSVFGDGAPMMRRTAVDVNYYYRYENDPSDTAAGAARMAEIEAVFRSRLDCRILNGQADLYDAGTGFRGINLEVAFFEAEAAHARESRS